jgi:hypothetical protein
VICILCNGFVWGGGAVFGRLLEQEADAIIENGSSPKAIPVIISGDHHHPQVYNIIVGWGVIGGTQYSWCGVAGAGKKRGK